mgnify:CR=1 FL=1
MIYSLEGKLETHGENFLVLNAAGIGFKILTNKDTLSKAETLKGTVKFFCFLYVRDEQMELYGFLEEQALKFFEMLNTISGVGPKTALGILDIDSVPNIMAAIIEKKSEFLTRTSGIGKKTAERVILELNGRIKLPGAKALTEKMSIDMEVEEALVGLGYPRYDIRRALSDLDFQATTLEQRLRAALKAISKKF